MSVLQAIDSAVKSVLPSSKEPASASRRLLILLHGEKASDDLVREAVTRLRSEGHQVTVRVTYEAGDTDRLVREALTLRSVDTLVAAGGDGTVCEVVAALLAHTGGLKDTREVGDAADPVVQARGRPPVLDAVSVAILPMGTSNDFAATTGIPEDPYEALLLATKGGSMRRIDVGLLNGKVFMNTATIGASADAGKITGSGIKRLLGPFAFLVTGFRTVTKWQPVPSVMCFPNIKEHGTYGEQKQSPDAKGQPLATVLQKALPAAAVHTAEPDDLPSGRESRRVSMSSDTPLSTPGATPPHISSRTAAWQTGSGVGELEGVPLLHVTAANNRQVASMLSVSPDAVLDDGMLDIIYLTGGAGEQVRRLLLDLLFKGPSRTQVVSTLLRVPWLEVATERPLEWSLDGDPMPEPTSSFRFSLLHRAVQVHLPDDRMLVSGQPDPKSEDEALAAKRKHKHGRSNPLRLPRGRLHPPSLSAMISGVVRFRKKKNWGAMLRSGALNTMKVLLWAGAGGALVHWLHTRKPQDKDADNAAEPASKGRFRLRRRRKQAQQV